MATIFDSARNSYAPYVSRFVGSNFEEASKVGAALDERYRQNQDITDRISIAAAQEQYLETDKAIKDNMVKSIYGQIDKIAKSDESFENSTALVSKLAKDFFTNQDRIAAVENFKRVEEARALRTRLGENYLNFGDDPETFSTLDPETGKSRLFEHGIEQRADYSGTMQKLLGKVAEDGFFISPSGATMKFNDVERHYIRTGQLERIDTRKLNDLVEGLLPVYKNTGAGQQDIRRLTQLEGFSNEPLQINEGRVTRQTTDVDEDIRNRFRALAYPQRFRKEFGRVDDFGYKTGDEKFQSGAAFSPTLPGSPTDNTSLSPIEVATKEEQEIQMQGIISSLMSGQSSFANPKEVDEAMANLESARVQAESDMNNYFTALTQEFPQISQYYGDYEKFKESYKEAIKNHKKLTPTGHIIQPEQAENYSKIINATAAVSPIYFKDREPMSLEELAKDLGTDPQNIKFEPISTYYDSPNKSIPGGYIEARVKTGVGEGKVVSGAPNTVFLPLSDQFTQLAQPIDVVMKNSFYAGRDTFTPDNPYIPGINSYNADGIPQASLAIYTRTYPKRKEDQQPGKPAFDTFVFEGKLVPNGSGGTTLTWNETPEKINDWRNKMIDRLAPSLEQVLNSGQTLNMQDYKKRGLDF